jgi:DNA polymerase elongation subunit (family B)
MKLFESSWKEGYEFFERYYDENLNMSMKKRIDLPFEWYEEDPRGLYTYILDDTVRLSKKQGNAKQGREQYGFLDPMYRNIRDNYWNQDKFNTKPRILYLDIETRSGTVSTGFPVPEKSLEPISMFQIYDSNTKNMIILGLKDWKHQDDYKYDFPVKYIKCNDEIHLIDTYLNIFQKLDPLIIYAWNGDGFDYPYMYNRIKKLGMDVQRLSNYGKVTMEEGEFQGKITFKFKALGHFYMDLQKVYKKFTFAPRAGYSLDYIAEIELDKKKVNHSEYVAFDDFYTGKYVIPDEPTEEQLNSKIYKAALAGDWDEVKELAHSEFVNYGCIDTYLIKEIDEGSNFTTLMMMISEKMGVQIGDTLGTIKPWSQYILNKSMTNQRVMPKKQDFDQPDVVGGHVMAPNAGKHHWIMSEDVTSMYPLLGMVGFNMSPETYVPIHKLPPKLRDIVLQYFNDQDETKRLGMDREVWDTTSELLKEHKLSLAINGAVFSQEKVGLVPEMVLDIFDSRKIAKKTQFKYEGAKVLIQEILKDRNEGVHSDE